MWGDHNFVGGNKKGQVLLLILANFDVLGQLAWLDRVEEHHEFSLHGNKLLKLLDLVVVSIYALLFSLNLLSNFSPAGKRTDTLLEIMDEHGHAVFLRLAFR